MGKDQNYNPFTVIDETEQPAQDTAKNSAPNPFDQFFAKPNGNPPAAKQQPTANPFDQFWKPEEAEGYNPSGIGTKRGKLPPMPKSLIPIASRLDIDPDHLWRVIHFESGGNPKAVNPKSGATGLIQFLPDTARMVGTTVEALKKMTFEQQLPYVEEYLRRNGARGANFADLYSNVLYPMAQGKPDEYPLFRKGSRAYSQNSALDRNKDGVVTKREAAESVYGGSIPTGKKVPPLEVTGSAPTHAPDVIRANPTVPTTLDTFVQALDPRNETNNILKEHITGVNPADNLTPTAAVKKQLQYADKTRAEYRAKVDADLAQLPFSLMEFVRAVRSKDKNVEEDRKSTLGQANGVTLGIRPTQPIREAAQQVAQKLGIKNPLKLLNPQSAEFKAVTKRLSTAPETVRIDQIDLDRAGVHGSDRAILNQFDYRAVAQDSYPELFGRAAITAVMPSRALRILMGDDTAPQDHRWQDVVADNIIDLAALAGVGSAAKGFSVAAKPFEELVARRATQSLGSKLATQAAHLMATNAALQTPDIFLRAHDMSVAEGIPFSDALGAIAPETYGAGIQMMDPRIFFKQVPAGEKAAAAIFQGLFWFGAGMEGLNHVRTRALRAGVPKGVVDVATTLGRKYAESEHANPDLTSGRYTPKGVPPEQYSATGTEPITARTAKGTDLAKAATGRTSKAETGKSEVTPEPASNPNVINELTLDEFRKALESEGEPQESVPQPQPGTPEYAITLGQARRKFLDTLFALKDYMGATSVKGLAASKIGLLYEQIAEEFGVPRDEVAKFYESARLLEANNLADVIGTHSSNGQHYLPDYFSKAEAKTEYVATANERSAIEAALFRGEDVPQRFLDKYPDIAAKYGKATNPTEKSTEPATTVEATPSAKPKPIEKTNVNKAPQTETTPPVVSESASKVREFTDAQGQRFTSEYMNPNDLGVMEGLQFKRFGITDKENAVSDELKGTTVYDHGTAGALTIWETKDGKRWVVNGHHRRELAIRTGETEIPVKVYREADGITFNEARTIGALQNLRDGKGTAIDIATVLRDLAATKQSLRDLGIDPTKTLAKDAVSLLGLSPESLKFVEDGDVREAVAAGIADANLPHDREQAVMKLAAKDKTIDTRNQGFFLAEKARTARMRRRAGDMGNLFGEFDAELALAEQSKIADEVMKRLASSERLYKLMLKGKKAGDTVIDETAQGRAAAIQEIGRKVIATDEATSRTLEQEAIKYANNPTRKQLQQSVDAVIAEAERAADTRYDQLTGKSSQDSGDGVRGGSGRARTTEPASTEPRSDTKGSDNEGTRAGVTEPKPEGKPEPKPEPKPEATVPETPKPEWGMKRSFMLGGNRGDRNVGTFESKLLQQLYDLGSKQKNSGQGYGKAGRGVAGGGGKTAEQIRVESANLRNELASAIAQMVGGDRDLWITLKNKWDTSAPNADPTHIYHVANEVYNDVRAQAKKAGPDEQFTIVDNITKQYIDNLKKSLGKQEEPKSTPKRSQDTEVFVNKPETPEPEKRKITPSSIGIKTILTPAGAIKTSALDTNAGSSVWFHQGDPAQIKLAAKVTFMGVGPTDAAISLNSKIEAASDRGYKFRNLRAGKYGTVWVLERNGSVLTRDGLDNILKVSEPYRPTDAEGDGTFGPRLTSYAQSFVEWMDSLGSDHQASVTKMINGGELPWVKLQHETNYHTLLFLDANGKEDLRIVGDSIGDIYAQARKYAKEGALFNSIDILNKLRSKENAPQPKTPEEWTSAVDDGTAHIANVPSEIRTQVADAVNDLRMKRSGIQNPGASGEDSIGQRRAAAGGEVGLDGIYYPAGSWMPREAWDETYTGPPSEKTGSGKGGQRVGGIHSAVRTAHEVNGRTDAEIVNDAATPTPANAEPPVTDEVTAALGSLGITITSRTLKNGQTVWDVGGNTYGIKDLLKSEFNASFSGYNKSWTIWGDENPSASIVDKLKQRGILDAGDVKRLADRGGINEADRLAELRRRLESTPDDRPTSSDAIGAVDASTKSLIEKGTKFGIPQEVVNDQIEDVGKIALAFEKGHPLFLLSSDPGSGKTFVLGGAIRELRRRGVKSFTYVTMNNDLITQIKKDLAAYGIDDVNFVTYAKIEEANSVANNPNRVIILDEGHNIKNIVGKRGIIGKSLLQGSKFTIIASATPYENPVQAAYLAPTGIFDSIGGHRDYVVASGGEVKVYKGAGKDGQDLEVLTWPSGNHEGGRIAKDWLDKLGVTTHRSMRIDPKLVDTSLRKTTVDDEWVKKYTDLVGAYDLAVSDTLGDNGEAVFDADRAMIKAHSVNTLKRVLEAAKIDSVIERAEEVLSQTDEKGSPRNVVIFIETKADRKIGRFRPTGMTSGPLYTAPEINRMMEEWEQEAAMARQMGDSAPKRPFSNAIVRIANAMHNLGLDYELPSVEDIIVNALGGPEQVAIYTGNRTSKQATEDKEAFLSGKKRVIVATMAKGGTGLSLHDKVGNRPTTQIGLNLPWSATQVDQVLGRINRYGLRSKANIEWIYAPQLDIEQMLANRVGRRMTDMGAIVKGHESVAGAKLADLDSLDSITSIKQLTESEAGTPEPVKTEAPKEPWQMTREEFNESRLPSAYQKNPIGASNDSPDSFIGLSDSGVLGGNKLTPEQRLAWANAQIDSINEELATTRQKIRNAKSDPMAYVKWAQKARVQSDQKRVKQLLSQRKLLADFANREKGIVSFRANDHRNEVERALRGEKNVPPEVLADYPELAKQYAKTTVEPPATPKPVDALTPPQSKLLQEPAADLELVPEVVKKKAGPQPEQGGFDLDTPDTSNQSAMSFDEPPPVAPTISEPPRPTRPNGTLVPMVGDEVYQLVPGGFGMPAMLIGEVYSSKSGGLRVRIKETRAFIGGGASGKTYPITDDWIVIGDPAIEKAKQARLDRESQRQAQYDKENAEFRKRSTDAAEASGETKTTDQPAPIGSIVTHWFDGKPSTYIQQAEAFQGIDQASEFGSPATHADEAITWRNPLPSDRQNLESTRARLQETLADPETINWVAERVKEEIKVIDDALASIGGSKSEPPKPVTLQTDIEFAKSLREGEKTADEVRNHYASLVENRAAIIAELNKLTVADLTKRVGKWRASGQKKAEIVKTAYQDMLQRLVPGKSVSYSLFSETFEQALKRVVDNLTDEDIQAAAADRRKANAEMRKALTDPETESEFNTFIAFRGKDALTSEQRAKYDDLVATSRRSIDEARKEAKATVSAVDAPVDFTIKETVHTKKGHPIWIVQMSDRVERSVYNELSSRAKSLSGYFSSFGPKENHGFIFTSKENAERFANLKNEGVSGETLVAEKQAAKADATSTRLRETAQALIDKANEQLGRDRKLNTVKRAREGEYAIANANADIAMGKTIMQIADAIESGQANHLRGIKFKSQVETLNSLLNRALFESNRKNPNWKGKDYSDKNGRPVEMEDIDYIEYPMPGFDTGSLRDMITAIQGKPNTVRMVEFANRLIGQAGNEQYIKLTSTRDIEMVTELIKRAEKYGARSFYVSNWKERLAPYNRLQSADIKNVAELRAALREFLGSRAAKAEIDPIKKAELALVGKKFPGYFPTPDPIAEDMARRLDIQPGDRVLEPNGGKGSLADAARNQGATVDVIEPVSDLRSILAAKGHNLVGYDFMEHNEPAKKIIMNPPFEDGQDITHVMHAFNLLEDGGNMVAIMSEGPFFRNDKQAVAFRAWLDEVGGISEQLPEGAFLSSDRPTGVRTRLVEISKPEKTAPTMKTPEPESSVVSDAGNAKEPWDMTRDELVERYGDRIQYGPNYDRSLATSVQDLLDAQEKGDTKAAEYFGRIVKLRAKEWTMEEFDRAGKENQPDSKPTPTESPTNAVSDGNPVADESPQEPLPNSIRPDVYRQFERDTDKPLYEIPRGRLTGTEKVNPGLVAKKIGSSGASTFYTLVNEATKEPVPELEGKQFNTPWEAHDGFRRIAHKQAVLDALKAGVQLSPDVLKDYRKEGFEHGQWDGLPVPDKAVRFHELKLNDVFTDDQSHRLYQKISKSEAKIIQSPNPANVGRVVKHSPATTVWRPVEGTYATKVRTLDAIKADRQQIVSDLKAAWEKNKRGMPRNAGAADFIDPEVFRQIGRLAHNIFEEGVFKGKQLYEKVQWFLAKKGIEISAKDIEDAHKAHMASLTPVKPEAVKSEPAQAQPVMETPDMVSTTEPPVSEGPELTSIKNRIQEGERETRGAEPIDKRKWANEDTSYERGRQAVLSGKVDPYELVNKIARGEITNSTEQGALNYIKSDAYKRYTDYLEEKNAAGLRLDDAIKDGKPAETIDRLQTEYESAKSRLAEHNDWLDRVDTASSHSGTDISAALNARKKEVEPELSDAKAQIAELRRLGGADPTPEEVGTQTRISNEYAELERKYTEEVQRREQVEKQLSERQVQMEAQRRIAQAIEEERKAKAQKRAQTANAKSREAAKERIKDRLSQYSKSIVGGVLKSDFAGGLGAVGVESVEFLADIAPDVMEIVKTYVADGVATLREIIPAVQKEMTALGIKLDEGQIRDIIAGVHDAKKPKAAISPLAQLKADARDQVAKEKATLAEMERQQKAAWAKTEKERAAAEKALEEEIKKQQAKEYRSSERAQRQTEKEQLAAARTEQKKQESQKRKEYVDYWRKRMNDEAKAHRESIEGQKERVRKSIEHYNKVVNDTSSALGRTYEREKGFIGPESLAPPKGQQPKPDPVTQKELYDLELKKTVLKIEADELRQAVKQRAIINGRNRSQQFLAVAGSLVKAPSNLVASTDFSAPFNQGLFATISHPGISARAGFDALKSMTDSGYRQSIARVRMNPRYEIARAHGLKVAGTVDQVTEEWFLHTALDNLPIVKQSEHNYAAYLNKLRMDMFANLLDNLEKPLFKIGKSRTLNEKQIRALAEYVNTVTGVGTGKVADALKGLSSAMGRSMFAPGYFVSRWKTATATPLFNALRADRRLAGVILADYLKLVGIIGGSLFVAKQLGADVDTDRRSSNFGKFRVGDAWVDPWAGMLTPYRLTSQLLEGRANSDNTKITKTNVQTTLGYYLSGKAAPPYRALMSIIDGEAFGKSYDRKTLEGWKNLGLGYLPISVQNTKDVFEDDGLSTSQKIALIIAGGFGVNINTPSAKEHPRR